ncbi:glycosyltransferase [Amycolatopsis sp. NPDC051371]|uniref:glycosyltransferase n=1 Tax=Amycolatopsis sp. NPDC051371 TaxID=3155800 RepID=UPI00343C93B8
MRVLLTTWGSRGDVEPLAGLAVALRGLGVDSVVCAPPDEDFVALLEGAGVAHVPLGPSVRSVVTRERPDAFALADELVTARFTTLTAVADDCDVVVAQGLLPAGARDVAERAGLPYVYACYHLHGLPSPHQPPGARPGTPSPAGETDNRVLWRHDAERVNALYGPALNRHREALGLAPVDNVRDHVFTDRPWLAADPVLCPTDLDVLRSGAWILPDDRPLPGELEKFLDDGEPPVYVGFGSMAAYAPKGIAQVATDAVRAHGRRIVLGSGWAGLTAVDDAEDCFVAGEVNHQALFGRVAAVVHHGGAGTTTAAARAGAPQVVVPRIADQPYWAERVAELGIGAAHPDPVPTAESLSAALATAFASAGRTVEIRTDGATVAAKQLVELAG